MTSIGKIKNFAGFFMRPDYTLSFAEFWTQKNTFRLARAKLLTMPCPSSKLADIA
jgi:hypothetical protein